MLIISALFFPKELVSARVATASDCSLVLSTEDDKGPQLMLMMLAALSCLGSRPAPDANDAGCSVPGCKQARS